MEVLKHMTHLPSRWIKSKGIFVFYRVQVYSWGTDHNPPTCWNGISCINVCIICHIRLNFLCINYCYKKLTSPVQCKCMHTFKLYISECFAEDPGNNICQSNCFIDELQVELVKYCIVEIERGMISYILSRQKLKGLNPPEM